MSIEKLEGIRDKYYFESQSALNINEFMKATIETFKELRQQLAKKEDVIDVNDIKEVKRLNG